MSRTSPKNLKAQAVPEGLGGALSNPIQLSGLGRSGELLWAGFRGDPDDGTTGLATVIIFEAPIPLHPDGRVPGENRVWKASPPAAPNVGVPLPPQEDWALWLTNVNIAPSATVLSDEVNIRDITGGTAGYATPKVGNALFLVILGVTGKVHCTFRAEGQ